MNAVRIKDNVVYFDGYWGTPYSFDLDLVNYRTFTGSVYTDEYPDSYLLDLDVKVGTESTSDDLWTTYSHTEEAVVISEGKEHTTFTLMLHQDTARALRGILDEIPTRAKYLRGLGRVDYICSNLELLEVCKRLSQR